MNRVKCTFSTQANMEGGGIIFTCLNIFFLSFFSWQYEKASRITNNILIIIIKWSGAGGYGWPVSPLSRHCLYFCVHTQLQYVYNRITVRLGPRNSKNKVSVHSWQIYSTSKIFPVHMLNGGMPIFTSKKDFLLQSSIRPTGLKTWYGFLPLAAWRKKPLGYKSALRFGTNRPNRWSWGKSF